MSGCCDSHSCKPKRPLKHTCPINGLEYSEVPPVTIAHHIARPWEWDDAGEPYYFCDDPECDVVYFSSSDKTITQNQLRTRVGQKDRSDTATLCYCYGVSRGDFRHDTGIKTYVISQTKEQACACDARNPSGRCCLKDFPRNNEDQ